MIDGLRSGKRVQSWILPKKKDDPDFCDMDVPLYTHPANDGLRKAVEEAIELLICVWQGEKGVDWQESELEEKAYNLRTALDKKS